MVECVNCAKFKWCDLSSPNVNECADYKETLTNEEYLRSCNTEQLAELLCDVWYGIDDVINIMAEDGEISKKDAVKIWLKQPHREE